MDGKDTPRITEADVRAYVERNGGISDGTDGTPQQITAVDFTIGAGLTRFTKSKPSIADDQLICIVSLQGSFEVGPPGSQGKAVKSNRALQIFDARTGNLLAEVIQQPGQPTQQP